MIALCQDCLRVVEVSLSDYKAADWGQGMCVCGGDTCHCETCIHTIEFLEKWDWSKICLEFKKPIIAWAPEAGRLVQ
jgi:hypothetical protein